MPRLDQHFLRDARLARTLATLCPTPAGSRVLEIGPGRGALTIPLVARYRVLAVEADANLAARLTEADLPGLTVKAGNFLRMWGQLDFDGVASTLSYALCEPLWRLLLKRPVPSLLVVSRSFAEKITGATLLGRLTAAVFEVARVREIAPEAFAPPPKTWSAALRLVPHAPPARGTLLRAWQDLLYLDRKKLRNALPQVLPGTKRAAKDRLSALPAQVLEKKVWQLSQAEFEKIDCLLSHVIGDASPPHLDDETLARLLASITARLKGRTLRWRLDGSCNLRVQGLDVAPRDLDLMADGTALEAFRNAFAGNILKDAPKGDGRTHILTLALEGIPVEILGDPVLGMLDAVRRIHWRGLTLPILPLPQAMKYYEALGRTDKVTLIESHLRGRSKK